MDFSDERWAGLSGGYKQPYDPRGALRKVKAGTGVEEAWAELWTELHHQGAVGEASYAAVTVIARLAADGHNRDWNPFALATVIEGARSNSQNPPLPAWLAEDYLMAWKQLFALSLTALPDARDEGLINSLIAVLAIHKSQPILARMALLTEDERRAMLDEVGWG